MSDIVERLRRWVHAVDAVSASDLMDEAADEISSLREAIRRIAEQDATLSVKGGNVTVEIDATLTDEERDAVKTAIGVMDWQQAYFSHLKHGEPLPSATLRGLLERLGGGR